MEERTYLKECGIPHINENRFLNYLTNLKDLLMSDALTIGGYSNCFSEKSHEAMSSSKIKKFLAKAINGLSLRLNPVIFTKIL